MSKEVYVIEKVMPSFGSCGKKAFKNKEEVKKYIIENLDWLLSLDYADWGKNNGYFVVEKIQLLGSDKDE